MCGYSNAAVFQGVTDEDIDFVENYVKTHLAERLAETKSNCDERLHFFHRFANDTKQFSFNRGERLFISEIVKHLRKTNELPDGLTRFKLNEDKKSEQALTQLASRELCNSSIGLVFGRLKSSLDVQKNSNSIIKSNSTEKGIIDFSEPNEKKIPSTIQSKSTEECVADTAASNAPEFIDIEDYRLKYDLDTQMDLLYTQLYTQIVRMKKITTDFGDEMNNFIVDFRDKKNPKVFANICKITTNGNCLFAAVVHQIYPTKLNSSEHQQMTADLRKSTVSYISDHLDMFKDALKDRLLEGGLTKDLSQLEENCGAYLENKLSKDGCWGGTESLRAISAMNQVNILILNEDGSCNLVVRFNSEYERTIILSYRSIGGKKKNHFDSIVDIEESFLIKLTEHLIALEKKNVEFQNEILNCKNIVFEIE